ncbi:hypothetical protein Tsubulata_012135 [Turnera subulata]|uniref:Exocyst subunit Exo70 family protein n=1 Tax=Turnera subulata TaxID=218843 RepID=A0A9Q0JPU5_9ROSI|nr:hypothetical protein Tsubulata_012135 [Turnera subulata]
MPRKGMRSICFSPKTTSFLHSPRSSPSRLSITASSTTPRLSFTDSMMDQTIDNAAALIMKWNPEASTFAKVTSLFYESKREARQFLRCVADLQKIMHLLSSQDSSTNDRLVLAQTLMQVAMKRLQKEFYQILSMNRAHLDPESVSTRSSRASASSTTSDFEYDDSPDDEAGTAGDSITEVEQFSSMATSDLRAIAECMISAGYAMECISIYKVIRKSIIDEGIFRLGVEKLSSSQVNKMDWESLDLRIKTWVEAVKISTSTLFTGERILCDQVFGSSETIRESCFADISRDGALLLFSFPELVSGKSKKSPPPEKMFRALDMYTVISENWAEIESIFSFESTFAVRSQALASLVKLSESIFIMLSDFEHTIQKDSSKTPVPGGGLHPLTTYAVDYLTLLGDYSDVLTDIMSDWPPPVKTSLPESYFDIGDSDDTPAPAISVRFAWLILVLLCKLDSKAKHYKDVSLAYLFLANNLQHIVSKVRTSNIQHLLGEEWIRKHEVKVNQFSENYEKLAWGHVIRSLQDNPAAAVISSDKAKEMFKKFNSSFEEAFRKQSTSCIVPDDKLREEIKESIARKLTAVYRDFYNKYRVLVGGQRNMGLFIRYDPEDIGNYLSDLFLVSKIESGSSFPSSSTSGSSHRRRRG